ncbi:TPA: XRE family transcriptional regulator [Vibrio cholerae]|uniref:XRE family transcriptional regulator n=1 Tax=Vibrio cholerae TaxID=666 RepID=UPI0028DA05C8|nr:helix-turn-helix transcriptional regulator [Vibrio cholerae]ELJ8688075.1 helix-turn-helix transcriptional regulator [Vibrio cholerae]HDZ9324851.1 helix-turn-helix transcriptional regulator [Vibrio cholerae]
MKRIGLIISELRLKQRMTQRELASKVGVSSTAISQWEREENIPKSKHLLELSKIFNVPVQFLTGDSRSEEVPEAGCVLVPYYPSVLAAGGRENIVDDETTNFTPIPKHVIKNHNINNICCIGVAGDSMVPVLVDGSIVAIDRSETLIRDGKMYIFRHDGLLRVKCLKRTPKCLIVHSYNTSYEDETYSLDDLSDFEVFGRVFCFSCEV